MQPLKNLKYIYINDILMIKQNHIKFSIKTREDGK